MCYLTAHSTGPTPACSTRRLSSRSAAVVVLPLIGGGAAWWSFLQIDDAAGGGRPRGEDSGRGVYNIVDDDPAPVHEWLPATAAMLGAKAPFRVPAWVARTAAGEHLVAMMTRNRARIERQSEAGTQLASPSSFLAAKIR